jgi:RNA polymerase sigma factor (sigma-70 family)
MRVSASSPDPDRPDPTLDVGGLVRAAQGGDAIAMNDLLDLLAPYVGRLCGPIALQDAPDATQEALIAIFRNLGQLREPAALFGWARSIAVREAVRLAGRSARSRPAELHDLPAPGDPQLASDIRDVLDRLSPEHRAVLVLRDLEGLDERTAGDLLSLPEGTVKSRLHRARRSFREAWKR